MKYKVKKQFTQDPSYALQEILEDRGVTDFDDFIHPSAACELNPYNLENIEKAAYRLLEHLQKNSKICCIVD